MAQERTEPELDEQVAVVTGGTVGIGRAVCEALARLGFSVVVVGRRRERVESVARELEAAGDRRVLGVAGDVRSEQDMERMARGALERFGRIDVLVASAGILRARGASLKTLWQMSPAEWDEVVDTNLRGVFLANRAVLPAMTRQRRGHIINLSSTSGRKGYAFDTAYCASKFGVIGLSESLAEEVRPYGIKVQVLLPGSIDTPMWEQNGPIRRPEFALPVERVAELIACLITAPADTVVVEPVIEPFGRPPRSGWLGETAAERASRREEIPTVGQQQTPTAN